MKESLGWTQETSSDLLMMQLSIKLVYFHFSFRWLKRDDLQMMQLLLKLVNFSGFPLLFPMVKKR